MIEAMKQALEVYCKTLHPLWNTHISRTEAEGFFEAGFKAAIAEAEKQEPKCVVIVEVFGKDWRLEYMSLPVGRHKLYAQQYLYTRPQPKREWVGLTDEERMDILMNLNWDKKLSHMDTALAIEAKLKEKNT